MLTVTLYTKENCGLCDEVKAKLATLADAYPHQLTEVNINQNHNLFARYRYVIPDVEIGDTRLLAPIDPDRLRSLLGTAVSPAP
ncbi:MAG: glutaredoxin family protein [Anaerolineae bacterium]